MRIVYLLFAFVFLATQSFGKGKIAGKISDEKTGYAVINAVVVVQGTANGTITDIDGRYDLEVDPGTYAIEVKYPGYDNKIVEGIVVKDNSVTETNVAMSISANNNLEEVVVKTTRNRETVAALYIDQRNSQSLSSGISADIIKRSPDRSTGEVLKRVSGASVQDNKYVVIRGLNDRYNMAMVNGALMPSTEPDRKAFSFDIIPSNLIDNMIISKTATPDLPGDFAGGVVQVLTKDVPDEDFLNIGIGASYNTQSTFKDFKSNDRPGGAALGFPNSDYELPSSFGETPADYRLLSRDKQLAAAKELPNNYKVNNTTALPNPSLQASYGKSFKMKNGAKLGTILGVTYGSSQKIAPDFDRGKFEIGTISSQSGETQYRYNSNTAALANFAYVKGRSKITFKNLFNTIYESTYYERVGFSTSSLQQTKMYSTVPSSRQIYNAQLQGKHSVGKGDKLQVDWNLNYSSMIAKQTDLRTAFYGRPITYERGQVFLNPSDTTFRLIDRNSRRFFSDQRDNNFGGSFNVTHPFEINGKKQTLKAGYLGMYKMRDFSARVLQYEIDRPTASGATALPIDQIFATDNIGAGRYSIDDNTNKTDEYEASALLNAGYVMLDNQFASKWRAIWGVRVESYSQNLLAFNQAGQEIDKTDVFTDVLPSLNLTYDLNTKTKLRLGVSRTVNRPEFREIAPFAFTDFENLWSIVGNPDLTRGNITNVDFRYEIYPTPGEAITFGLFYKDFKNPIEAVLDPQTNLDFFIFGYDNAQSAYAAGIEFDVRKKLNFLGSQDWLDRLIFSANLTYIYSRVNTSNYTGVVVIPGTTAERPLQGQSPYIVNLSLLYNTNNGWAFSALYNRIGERISIVGNASIPTTWENGRNVVDLQVSKSILKGKGELKLTVSDLLNSPYTFYWNQTAENSSYQKGDRVVGTDDDLIFQQYRLGTGVSLGFTYNLFK